MVGENRASPTLYSFDGIHKGHTLMHHQPAYAHACGSIVTCFAVDQYSLTRSFASSKETFTQRPTFFDNIEEQSILRVNLKKLDVVGGVERREI